jgi:hypothetical protein
MSPGRTPEFADWRHHAPFTTSPLVALQAEQFHRWHALVEQVITVPARIARSAWKVIVHLP